MKEREPVGPVQVLPPGLVNLLQLKVGGYAPDALRQDIQPSLDMLPWWLRATRRTVREEQFIVQLPANTYASVQPLVGNVTLGPLVVGQREWWHVEACCFRVSNDTGSVTSPIKVGVIEPGGPGASDNNQTYGVGVTTLASAVYDVVDAHDFWMPPGARLGVWVGQVVGGVGNFTAVLQGLKYSVAPL